MYGATGIYSINYERLHRNKTDNIFSYRIGLAYIPNYLLINNYMSFYYYSHAVIPISISFMKHIRSNHYLEMRVAVAAGGYIYDDYSGKGLGDSTNNFVPKKAINFTIYPSIGVGYRYQAESNGLFFNILLMKAVISESEWYNKISIGAGYAF